MIITRMLNGKIYELFAFMPPHKHCRRVREVLHSLLRWQEAAGGP
jgi:hypothetical protein